MSICLFELWQMWNFFFNLLINTFLIVYGGCVISAQYLIVKSNRKRIVMTDAVPASQRQSEMKWSAFQLSTQRACLLPSCVAPMYPVYWPCCRRRAAVGRQLAAHVPCVLAVLQEACCCLLSTRCSTSTRASPRTASPSTAWQTSAPTSCSVSRGPS